jgi:hypothetical protein
LIPKLSILWGNKLNNCSVVLGWKLLPITITTPKKIIA